MKAKVGQVEEVKKEFENMVKSMSIESRLRFLLLPVKEESFEKAYNILTDPRLEIERYLGHAKLLAYKLGRVDENFLGRLLRSAFGFVEVELHTSEIGHYSLELEREFYNKLEDSIRWVKDNVSMRHRPRPGNEHDQQEESWLHWALKHLTYRHLICNEKVKEYEIKSEYHIKSKSEENISPAEGKIADVYVESESPIAIEIETMYGTGDPIEAKIRPFTTLPYLGFKGELWLVIPNLHALMYAKELVKFRRDCRKEGLKLEVYVADVTGLGAKRIYGEERSPGLIKFVDVLKFIKKGRL